MEGKLNVLIVYGLMGLIIALWPSLVKEKARSVNLQDETTVQSSRWLWKSLYFLIAFFGAFFIAGQTIPNLILSFAIIVSMLALSTGEFEIITLSSTFLALCVSTTLLWWQRHGHVLNISGFSTAAICFFSFLFIELYKLNPNPSIKITNFSKWLITYMLFATLLSFSTGIFSNKELIKTLWHHWGAYIGPVELLLSGAVIFHDFPVQYGLGPTLLIANGCGHDCWQGMYYVSSLTTLLFSLCIASLAFALTPKRWPERLITLLLCLTTCFFWAAFPPLAGSPIQTPSVSGLRFLPVIFLVNYLFFVSHIEHSKTKSFIAHLLWILGTLWSPESAFYVTSVWWPYYIFINRAYGNISLRIKILIKSTLHLLLIAIVLVVFFNIIFHIIYGKEPLLYAFLAYALNPPGTLPINSHGAIWYFILIISIGIISLYRLWQKSNDTFEFRSGFLLLLLNYSVFSYFLGRSHDNAFLNLSPFLLLVLLHCICVTDKKYLHRIAIICLMVFIGWLPAFNWQAWTDNLKKGKILSFNPTFIDDLLQKNYGLSNRSNEAKSAIIFLQNYKEPITVLNSNFSLMYFNPPQVWSAIHDPANYVFIPSKHRQEFIFATAKTLHRSGWLVIEKNSLAEMFLKDFDFAYRRTNYFDFGNYYAIRFSPKKIV